MSPIGIERVSIQIHSVGAIRGALKAINDHKIGLPEFIKNSAGAYYRLPDDLITRKSQSDRIIIIFFRKPRGRGLGSIGCLDLVGMNGEDVNLFQKWFDPKASSRGDESGQLWGGHGNGAKSYMLSLFNEAWFATVREGRFTQMGWTDIKNKDIFDENYKIGYIPSKSAAYEKADPKPLEKLDSLLTEFRAKIDILPKHVLDTLLLRPAWTLFVGMEAKSWVDPEKLLTLIKHSPQTIRAIEYCTIYSYIDGIPAMDGQPLSLEIIPALPGGESPFIVPVPASLPDPDGGDVDTIQGGRYPVGQLILHTSRDPMLYSLRSRHVIRCESSFKGVFGLFEVEDIAYRQADHIFGEIILEALQEYETNFRQEPNDSPLTRAVKEWIREQILSYAAKFSAQEQLRRDDRETKDLQEMNVNMNQFLKTFLEESEAEAGASRGSKIERIKGFGRTAVPGKEVIRIDHNFGHDVIICGENVTLNVRLEFLDDEGKRVKPIPVHWECSNETVAFAELGSIITGQQGECEVIAIGENGVRSAPIKVKVVEVQMIQITPELEPLSLGSRRYLKYEVSSNGSLLNDVKLNWYSDNEDFVKVGSNEGIVTATAAPGSSRVWASSESVESNKIDLETINGQGSEGPAPQYPKILLSEIDDDPDTGSPKSIPSDAGTIVQDVADRRHNIYWVNMHSPIANHFLRTRDYRSPEFKIYIAERYAEVVFRSLLRKEDQMLEPDYVEELLGIEPTRLRQAFADHFQEWLEGIWPR